MTPATSSARASSGRSTAGGCGLGRDQCTGAPRRRWRHRRPLRPRRCSTTAPGGRSEIVDGRLAELTWPDLAIRRARAGERDILILTGAEPDYRWQAFADAIVDVAKRLGVTEWISLGSIPAAVPHTRAVPILGTESSPGLLRGSIRPEPAGVLRVPSAAISVLEMTLSRPASQRWATSRRSPLRVGALPAAAVALLGALGTTSGWSSMPGSWTRRGSSTRLDAAAAVEETTRQYVERLEGMVDEERLPSGDDLITEIEKFLRDRGSEGPAPLGG